MPFAEKRGKCSRSSRSLSVEDVPMSDTQGFRINEKVITGGLLLLLGVLFILDNFHMIDAGSLWDYWPLFIIGPGLSRVLTPTQPGQRVGGLHPRRDRILLPAEEPRLSLGAVPQGLAVRPRGSRPLRDLAGGRAARARGDDGLDGRRPGQPGGSLGGPGRAGGPERVRALRRRTPDRPDARTSGAARSR